jgi:hypothetical protein
VKKIKTYLPFFVIIAVIAISTNMAMPNAYSANYTEQVFAIQKDSMWSLGKDLSDGDSYTFRICDPGAIPNYSAESYHYFTKGMEHNSSLCYVAKLDFVNLLDSDANEINRNIWVVQASISDRLSDSVRHYVFHIDSENFEVRPGNTIHPDAIRYAQSIQDTLFSIFKYSDEPKLLKLGSEWGPVTESLGSGLHPHMAVLDENRRYSAMQNMIDYDSNTVESVETEFSNVYQVGYDVDIVNSDIDVTTFYLVSPDIPFPLSGIKYSPVHVTKPFKVFEFELLSFVLQNKQDRMQDDATLTENDVDEFIFPDNDDSTNAGLTNNQDSSDEIIPGNTDNTTIEKSNAIVADDKQINNKDSDVTDDQNGDVTINTDDNNTENILANDSNDVNILTENDDTIINQDKTRDDTSADVILGAVLVVFVSLFIYFKIIRNLARKNPIKPKERNSFHNKTISFDDSLAIHIKTQKIDANNKASALKANDHSIGDDNK